MAGDVTLPTSGALTFLFTDIEGSTRKAHELGEDWFGVLETHHALLRPVFAAHGGIEVSTAGDSFFVVFEDAADAVAASVAMQRTVAAHDWSPHPPVRVRMGLHTGLARFREHDNDYAGLTVHAASRVESAAAGAQVLISQATLDAAEEEWPGDIDVLDLGFHRLKDLPSEVRLYQVVAAGLEREFPPVRGLEVVRNNVPVPPSTFIGRTEVLTRLHRLLEGDRLVTVIGPGGTGKTRVALRLATERLHRHADGVWFVELAGTTHEAGVIAAFAEALGVREDAERGLLDAIAANVQAKNLLLIADNCEHVIDAAASVIERLLASGAGVRVLSTSREPLEIEGERLWPLAPLSVDDETSEAVALLADRVALVQPDFELDETSRADALTIAQRLDGLPLALELAAASAASLPLDEIARQLDDRFALLTRGKRTAADRQKTLRGAIDWSYGLLGDREKLLFRRLGVFPAEFDFGVARAVCGDDTLDTDDVLSNLQRKSLVTETPSTRLRFLESIREFAREELLSSGELGTVAERHARYFVGDVSPDQGARSDWVDTVHEDIAAAMRWGGEHDRALQLRALVELQEFWMRKGRWTEGRATSDAVLTNTADLEIRERWRALSNTGQLALNQGDVTVAREYFTRAGDVAERVGTADEAQVALGDLGQIAVREGDLDTAEALFTRSLEAARRGGQDRATAVCLTHLANIASQQGALAKAWSLALEAVELARTFEWDDLDLALTSLLGVIARQRGQLSEARRVFADGLEAARKLDNVQPALYLLYCAAMVEIDDGSPTAARPLLREAISMGRDIGADADLAESLEAAARLAAAAGERRIGGQLLATVDALRERLEFPRQPAELAAYEALRSAVDTAAPALDLSGAVDAALAFLD